jgi:uncharacterized protein YodC (DUF2158 family)
MKGAFSTGDIVQLKSGGPKMTINYVDKDILGRDCASCEWFVNDEIETLKVAPEGRAGRAVA